MQGPGLAITALSIYVVGGIGAFTGITMIVLNKTSFADGSQGGPLGYLLLTGGIVLSLAGVLGMRIYRNRG